LLGSYLQTGDWDLAEGRQHSGEKRIHDIEGKNDFEILEVETDKNHIHLLVKSWLKVSTFASVRELETIDNN
jgi:putative transposase